MKNATASQRKLASIAFITCAFLAGPGSCAASSPDGTIPRRARSGNAPPVVRITTPSSTQFFRNHSRIVDVSASDPDGFIDHVDFYVNGAQFASDETEPFRARLQPAANGPVTITVRATDNEGAATTAVSSAFVVVDCPGDEVCDDELAADEVVCCLPLPAIHWVTPTPKISFSAPATVFLEVRVSRATADTVVEFYDGERLIGSVSSAPFRFRWRKVPAGMHLLTARARSKNPGVVVSGENRIRVQ